MADSKRQRIVSAIVTRMQGINGTGSYELNIASRAEDSRTNWDQNEMPAISVFDGDAEATPTSRGLAKGTFHDMQVMIRGFCEQGSTAANARKLIKDIQTAIRQDDKWTVASVPLAMQTRQVRDGIIRQEGSYEVEGCVVEIAVQFDTEKFNAE